MGGHILLNILLYLNCPFLIMRSDESSRDISKSSDIPCIGVVVE